MSTLPSTLSSSPSMPWGPSSSQLVDDSGTLTPPAAPGEPCQHLTDVLLVHFPLMSSPICLHALCFVPLSMAYEGRFDMVSPLLA